MKKLLALLLAAVMVLSLAACGGDEDPPPPNGNNGNANGINGEEKPQPPPLDAYDVPRPTAKIREPWMEQAERLVDILSGPNRQNYLWGTAETYFDSPAELKHIWFFLNCYIADVNIVYSYDHRYNLSADDLEAHIREHYWADFSVDELYLSLSEEWRTESWQMYDADTRTFSLHESTAGGNVNFGHSGVFEIIEMYQKEDKYHVLTAYGEADWVFSGDGWVDYWVPGDYSFINNMHVFEMNENGILNMVSKQPFWVELPGWVAFAENFIISLTEWEKGNEERSYITKIGFYKDEPDKNFFVAVPKYYHPVHLYNGEIVRFDGSIDNIDFTEIDIDYDDESMLWGFRHTVFTEIYRFICGVYE